MIAFKAGWSAVQDFLVDVKEINSRDHNHNRSQGGKVRRALALPVSPTPVISYVLELIKKRKIPRCECVKHGCHGEEVIVENRHSTLTHENVSGLSKREHAFYAHRTG